MKAFLLSCCAAVCAQGAFAFEWPSSGTATIPAGETAAIADADIANVANLDAIVLPDADSAVTASALSSALTLKANVSGPGQVAFTNCTGGVTLTGDNSDLTGSFTFRNTSLTVASRHGLGGSSTPKATFLKPSGSSAFIKFTGSGLTNDVPLYLEGDSLSVPNNGTAQMEQNATIDWKVLSGAGEAKYGNIHVTQGEFIMRNGGGYFSPSVMKNCTVHVGENAKLNWAANYGKGTHPCYLRVDSPVKKLSFNVWYVNELTLKAGCVNAFPTTLPISMNGSIDAGYDLNGFDQTLGSHPDYWYEPKQGETRIFGIKSETPATLTITDTASRNRPLKISGLASIDYKGGATYNLVNAQSTTLGDITVSSGTLGMKWGYAWNGSNMTVKAGATLKIDTTAVMNTGVTKLTVEAGGALDVPTGCSLVVAAATFAGTAMEVDSVAHPISYYQALCPDVTLTGDGYITVLEAEEEGEFEWPTEPGQVAKIPRNKTVYAGDDKMTLVNQVAGIKIGLDAQLVFTNLAETYTLEAPVTGFGTFLASNCVKVVLNEDSSNFGGHFAFDQTPVIVSNRYGLGSVITSAATFNSSPLSFGGAGWTNDVALLISDGAKLPYNDEGTLVQNNDLKIGVDGSNTSHLNFNDIEMMGGLFQPQGSTFYPIPANKNKRMFFGKNVVYSPIGNSNILGTGYHGVFEFETTNVKFGYFALSTEKNEIRLAATNVLKSTTVTFSPGASYDTKGTMIDDGINLNGYDQLVAALSSVWYTPAAVDGRHCLIRSATPAVMTVTGGGTTLPLIFREKVGFTVNLSGTTPGTYTIVNRASDTEGPLTVTRGTLSFKWSAGWFGPNVIVNGGTLQIQETARADFFNPDGATGRSTTHLAVSDGGTVDLGTDVAARVGYLSTNGVELVRGTYGGSDAGLDAAHTLPCLTGAGTITVQRGKMRGLMLILK